MTISYVQAFLPFWYIPDTDGTAAGGAQLFTYDSLTRLPKAIYQDAGGTQAWPNPTIFNLNGTQGPFYWLINSATPNDNYYIEIYNADGVKLYQADNFPSTQGGGGGNVTTYIPIVNYINNNQFINHIDDQPGPLPTNLVVASSNHKGFTPALTNPVVGTYGVLGPDIRFVKNNTNATDAITFETFALASYPLTGDVTPADYVHYSCTNTPAGETYKSFQFPITQKVKNLSNQIMTFGVWAAVAATPVTINIFCRQYYGSGTGATVESGSTRTTIGSCNLTTTWQWFPLNFIVPSAAGKTLGTPGLQTDDDALYIQIDMPLGQPCDVFFIKPALFLGTIDPDSEFSSYDMIDSIDQTPRTGDIRVSYWTTPPQGWLAMNDTTIGNTGSLATTRGQFTFQLYKTLWDAVSNTYAQVSGGRGASAIADFLQNKTLALPLALGRALANTGTGSGLTAKVLGQFAGAELQSVTLALQNIPQHTHTYQSFVPTGGAGTGIGSGLAAANLPFETGTGTGLTNPPTPFLVNTITPSSFYNVFIKL